MNPTFIQHKISGLLKEMDTILSGSNHSAIETELLKQKCISIYEHVLQLQSFESPAPPNSPMEKPVPEVKPLIEAQMPVVPSAEKEVIRVVETPPEAEKPVQLHKTETPGKLIDTLHDEMSIHKKMVSSIGSQGDLNKNFHSKGISIKSAISLNQKISFVNILFSENTVEYAKAIDKLNEVGTQEEAMRYFSEMKDTYHWDKEEELVKELQKIIEKRFA